MKSRLFAQNVTSADLLHLQIYKVKDAIEFDLTSRYMEGPF